MYYSVGEKIGIGVGLSVIALLVTFMIYSGMRSENPSTPAAMPDVGAEVSRTTPTPEEWRALDQVGEKLERDGRHLMSPVDNLPLVRRQAIYREISRAIERSELRGEKEYDYRDEVAAKFSITRGQINAIAVEGVKNRWAME